MFCCSFFCPLDQPCKTLQTVQGRPSGLGEPNCPPPQEISKSSPMPLSDFLTTFSEFGRRLLAVQFVGLSIVMDVSATLFCERFLQRTSLKIAAKAFLYFGILHA